MCVERMDKKLKKKKKKTAGQKYTKHVVWFEVRLYMNLIFKYISDFLKATGTTCIRKQIRLIVKNRYILNR